MVANSCPARSPVGPSNCRGTPIRVQNQGTARKLNLGSARRGGSPKLLRWLSSGAAAGRSNLNLAFTLLREGLSPKHQRTIEHQGARRMLREIRKRLKKELRFEDPREHKRTVSRWEYHDYIRSPEWQERRRQFFESGPGTRCYCCHRGRRPGFHVHHRTYKRLGQEYDADLLLVCPDCHKLIHDLQKETGISVTRATDRIICRFRRKQKRLREVKAARKRETTSCALVIGSDNTGY